MNENVVVLSTTQKTDSAQSFKNCRSNSQMIVDAVKRGIDKGKNQMGYINS